MSEHDAEREASVRERLTSTVEGYPVHKGCGGEVAYDEDLIGTCMACDQRVPDPRAQWSLADNDGRLGCEEYVRDVSVLIIQIDALRSRLERAEAVLLDCAVAAHDHQRQDACRLAAGYLDDRVAVLSGGDNDE